MSAAPPSLPFDTSASQHLNPSWTSFLSESRSHLHLVTDYKDSMQSKCNFTLVCKQLHVVGLQNLLQTVWITSSRDAGLLAQRLEADACIRRCDTLYSSGRSAARVDDGVNIGVYIKRLHIETVALDRCAPEDIITILTHAPSIDHYRDLQSIFRNPRVEISLPRYRNDSAKPSRWRNPARFFPAFNPNPHNHLRIVRLEDSFSHQGPSLHILSTLFSNPDRIVGLRVASWTFYDYDEEREGTRPLEKWVVPNLHGSRDQLQLLEITFPPGDTSFDTLDTFFNPLQRHDLASPKALSGVGITVTVTTETDSTVTNTRRWSRPTQDRQKTVEDSESSDLVSVAPTTSPLSLPAMRSLRFTSNNPALSVLSSWDMPNLRNLAIALNAIPGASEFQRFFMTHGSNLTQLELGTLSQCLPSYGRTLDVQTYHNAITKWCPNLTEFICTAEEEWNEEDIFWTPHALLDAHSNIQTIAIRNLDRCIFESIQALESRSPAAFLAGGLWHDDDFAAGYHHSVFAGLIRRFRHLIDKKSFPSLRALRDLSPSLHHATNSSTALQLATVTQVATKPSNSLVIEALAAASRVVEKMRTTLLSSGMTKHRPPASSETEVTTQERRRFYRRKAEQEFWKTVGKMSLFNGMVLQDHQGHHVVATDSDSDSQ